MTNLSIGGNVTDSVIVFGNNNFVVNVGDLNGSTVNIIKPSDRPKFSARPAPVVIKPRNFHSLLDRKDEFELIKQAYQSSVPISVWGRDGVGKTSFIRYLTHHLDAGNFPGGLLYLNVSGLEYEDLLQALFDSFYDSAPSYKPTTTEIIHALQNLKALIILDDIQIGRDEIASILDAVPSSAFLLTSRERNLWGDVEIIPLRGLPESESLQLFEKELSRPLTEQERSIVTKVCTLLEGHPLQILQAAALSRDCGIPVEDLLNGMETEGLEDKSTAYIRMAKLNPAEKQILALLAAAGGNIVPQEVIKGIFKDNQELKTIERLVTLGLVQSHSPRFSITDALTSSISATWDLASWQDLLLNHAINWLGQKPASALVNESSGLLMHVIKNAGERKKWREVIQLGRALEKFMIFHKRWHAWADILNLVLTAARALNDRKVEAWALHQLGSRALYLGNASEARTILTQALNIRQAIGDKAGLAVTRHNINTLNGIVTPPKGNTSGCSKYLTCGLGAMIGLAMILAVVIWLAINFSVPPQNTLPVEPVTDHPTDTAVPSFTPSKFPTTTRRPTSTPRPTNTPITPSPTRIPTDTPTFPPPTEVTIKTFVNVLSNFCLDSNLEGYVYALDCNGGDYQNWQIQGERLVNVATGLCLDSNFDGVAYTLDCNGGDYQNWQRQGELLVNVATDLCLYGRGNDVFTFDCSPPSSGTSDGPPTSSQNWK